jgi:hypothetical protein
MRPEVDKTDVDTRRRDNTKRELRFPTVPEEEAARLIGIVDAVRPLQESVTVPLDLVLAYVRTSSEPQHEVEVNLDPPKIFYSQKPAILVMFMGDPQLKPVGGTPVMFAINTNWDLFFDTSTSTYFLLNSETWLTTAEPAPRAWTPDQAFTAKFLHLPDDPNWAEAKKRIPASATARRPWSSRARARGNDSR